jgi:preprotein translocase subunit SecB
MAEQGNGASQQPVAGARSLAIGAQYIKDLSFENPRAPQSLMQQQAPEVSINIDVKAQVLGENAYEVVLSARAEAKLGADPLFVVELAYGAVVTLQNVEQDAIPLALLVEAPRLLFPFARAILANATRDGGFPPLLLNPIDFAELLRRQQVQAQAGVTTATA